MWELLEAKLTEMGAFAGTLDRRQIAQELTWAVPPQRDTPDQDDEGYHGEAHDIAASKLAGGAL